MNSAVPEANAFMERLRSRFFEESPNSPGLRSLLDERVSVCCCLLSAAAGGEANFSDRTSF